MPSIHCSASAPKARTCPFARRGSLGGTTPAGVCPFSQMADNDQVCTKRESRQAPQTDVTGFLQQVGLEKHAPTLLANGFEDVETLLAISEDDLKTFEHIEDLRLPLQELLALKAQSFGEHRQTPRGRTCGPGHSVRGEDLPDKAARPESVGATKQATLRPSWLTDDTHRLLKKSWQQLQIDNCEKAGALLCDHYCLQSPEDAASCGMDWSAVIKVIGFPIDRMDNLAFVKKRLRCLGANHAKWGTKEHQFETMKYAFLHALRDALPNDFTSDLELAWDLMYQFVATEMIAGLKGN